MSKSTGNSSRERKTTKNPQRKAGKRRNGGVWLQNKPVGARQDEDSNPPPHSGKNSSDEPVVPPWDDGASTSAALTLTTDERPTYQRKKPGKKMLCVEKVFKTVGKKVGKMMHCVGCKSVKTKEPNRLVQNEECGGLVVPQRTLNPQTGRKDSVSSGRRPSYDGTRRPSYDGTSTSTRLDTENGQTQHETNEEMSHQKETDSPVFQGVGNMFNDKEEKKKLDKVSEEPDKYLSISQKKEIYERKMKTEELTDVKKDQSSVPETLSQREVQEVKGDENSPQKQANSSYLHISHKKEIHGRKEMDVNEDYLHTIQTLKEKVDRLQQENASLEQEVKNHSKQVAEQQKNSDMKLAKVEDWYKEVMGLNHRTIEEQNRRMEEQLEEINKKKKKLEELEEGLLLLRSRLEKAEELLRESERMRSEQLDERNKQLEEEQRRRLGRLRSQLEEAQRLLEESKEEHGQEMNDKNRELGEARGLLGSVSAQLANARRQLEKAELTREGAIAAALKEASEQLVLVTEEKEEAVEERDLLLKQKDQALQELLEKRRTVGELKALQEVHTRRLKHLEEEGRSLRENRERVDFVLKGLQEIRFQERRRLEKHEEENAGLRRRLADRDQEVLELKEALTRRPVDLELELQQNRWNNRLLEDKLKAARGCAAAYQDAYRSLEGKNKDLADQTRTLRIEVCKLKSRKSRSPPQKKLKERCECEKTPAPLKMELKGKGCSLPPIFSKRSKSAPESKAEDQRESRKTPEVLPLKLELRGERVPHPYQDPVDLRQKLPVLW